MPPPPPPPNPISTFLRQGTQSNADGSNLPQYAFPSLSVISTVGRGSEDKGTVVMSTAMYAPLMYRLHVTPEECLPVVREALKIADRNCEDWSMTSWNSWKESLVDVIDKKLKESNMEVPALVDFKIREESVARFSGVTRPGDGEMTVCLTRVWVTGMGDSQTLVADRALTVIWER